MRVSKFIKSSAIVATFFMVAGCATQVIETASPVKPATKKFGQYSNVILVKAKLASDYADQGPNIKAANKIDEILEQKLSATFSNLEVKSIEEAQSLTSVVGEKVLVIRPLIKQIKFIGGAARFWAGAMAGSSVVIMDTAFTDLATGEELANPGYMRKAGAYTDAFGVASNRMLEDVAIDVGNYAAANQ